MTLKVTDEPPDRPEWVSETIRLVSEVNDQRRGELLARVARASDADLTGGSDDAWGLGQIAVHLLLIERGAALIALGLSKGELPGNTGQPRPSAAAVTREGIASLARKAGDAAARLRAEFPAVPDTATVARHPYYGDLNAFGWLLMVPNHYLAHLQALDTGRTSAL
ncbi:MAG TPA: DinB family protein [Candidatus Limnocylindria bacterium]